jgi:mevalonate kinase
MKRFLVSAPGKLHLLGEHVVVHNKPAIIAAVDKRCFVEISLRKDQKIRIVPKNYKQEIIVNFSEIVSKFKKAEKNWKKYNENNDIELLKSIAKNPLDYPSLIIGQFINYFKLQSTSGFDLKIDSQIPVGAGMGSSAALSVSIIAALCLFTNKSFDKEVINKIAYLSEQKKHGKPSGGDNTTSCFGGLIWYKKDEGMKSLNIKMPKNMLKNFYVVNTGTPSETTGEMVSGVKNLLQKRPEFTQTIFDDQERLVKNLLTALKRGNGEEAIQIIRKGEENLEKLGVVSLFVQKIIREIEKTGGAAKICGGGGIKKGTGMLLIYHQDLESLEKVLKSHQLKPNQLTLGVQGLRVENINDTI